MNDIPVFFKNEPKWHVAITYCNHPKNTCEYEGNNTKELCPKVTL